MILHTQNPTVFASAVYQHLKTIGKRNTFGTLQLESANYVLLAPLERLTRQPSADDWDNISMEFVDVAEGYNSEMRLTYFDFNTCRISLVIGSADTIEEAFQALCDKLEAWDAETADSI
jgi:hypothetical protein